MIKFKRGKTRNWRFQLKPLADGQPGYDRDKHKIKIGDGKTPWIALPYASGLAEEEILNSEALAKARYIFDPEDTTIFTYGTEEPDDKTVGKVYLQYYETDPEADYVVEIGSSGIWTYRKWKSGIAECWGTYKITAIISEPTAAGTLYYDNSKIKAIKYPKQVSFISDANNIPHETVSIQSDGWVVWISAVEHNTNDQTAVYRIISPQSIEDPATYYLTFNIKGRWK